MKNINRTIKSLKKIICDENCRHMNLSTIKGYLGELIVKTRLESEGCIVEQKGNQCGYDLEFENIKIDVKTSTLKEETPGKLGWGWALKQKSKKRKLSCTHFVCLALDKKNNEKAFYIIRKEDIGKFPANSKRFKNVENRFGVYLNKNISNKKALRIGNKGKLRKFLT
jgi:hypothetical protein